MGNPDWAINLLDRGETLVEFLRRNNLTASTSISNFRTYIRSGLAASDPLPPGEKYRSLKQCLAVNFLEGCTIGGGLSILVSVVPPLLKGKVRRALKDVPTSGNLRVALFFGLLMSLCNSGMYLNKKAPPSVAALRRLRFLIGLIAGTSVTVLPAGVRRFVLYLLLTRAIEIAARLVKTELRARRMKQKEIVEDTDSEASTPSVSLIEESGDLFSSHEIVGLASVSMTVIITAWFRFSDLVPHGYLHFLEGINNLTPRQVKDVQHILKSDLNVNPLITKIVNRKERICAVYHPEEQGCLSFYLSFLLKGIITRSGPFYLKLYFLPLLFSIIKRKGKNISSGLALSFFKRVWWSSLFLATMNATAAGTVCAMSHLRPLSYDPKIPFTTHASLGGYMCGLALYLEQDSRRLELALYLFGQAIQILVNAYKKTNLWYPSRMDSISTATSIAVMLYAFWENDIIRPGYASLIGRIIDTSDNRHSYKIF
jgi:hypothetical protein